MCLDPFLNLETKLQKNQVNIYESGVLAVYLAHDLVFTGQQAKKSYAIP